jgi:hypothetical protein
MDKWRVMESEIRMTQGLERLRHIKMWSFQDAREFVTVGIWRQDRAELFLALIDRAEENSKADRGPPTPALAILNLESTLRSEMMNSFHVVDHAGGITGLGSMVFRPEDGMRTWKLYDRNAPSILVSNLIERGNFCRTSGVPGAGKTNLACVLAEEYVKLPNRFAIGNIRMLSPDPRFLYVRSARGLFETIADLPDDSHWLFNHDEGGLSYAKPDQATRRVKDLDKLMYCIRKLGGNYNLIEQREDSIPKVIMEFAKNIFFCEWRGKQRIVSIEMRGPELAFRDTVKDFPKSSLPFDTNDIAMFDIDIDVLKLFSAINEAESPKKAMREFLDREVKFELTRKCAIPDCPNEFTSPDRRVKYCETHRRFYTGGRDRVYSVKEDEDKKRTLGEFLQ